MLEMLLNFYILRLLTVLEVTESLSLFFSQRKGNNGILSFQQIIIFFTKT